MESIALSNVSFLEQARRYLFLTASEWKISLTSALLGAVCAIPISLSVSPWIPVTVFLFFLTVCHMRYAAPFIVPLPHIAIMISMLEYVFAAWAQIYYPPSNPIYDIGLALPFYLAFVGPVIVGICLGWALSLSGLSFNPRRPVVFSDARVLTELDILIVMGLIATFVAPLVQDTDLAFVGVLAGYLRFIGVYGRMILKAPGWKWRLAIALGGEILLASATAMFNPLLLWCLWTFAIWIYCYTPSFRIVTVSLIAGAILLPSLQEAKWRLRGGLPDIDVASGVEFQTSADRSSTDRTFAWAEFLSDGLVRTVTLQLPEEFLSDTITRYNQGWIVNRTMFFVPDTEPFAQGETLRNAIRAAILPRVIDKEKLEAGGRVYMERYAGLVLSEETSMNLGYAGEMYVNFGRAGGIVGCGIYAFAFGLLFRAIARRASVQPLWWSIVPFIFFAALKGDDGVDYALTWTVKGCVLLAFIILFLPNLRHALFQPLRQRQTALIAAHPGEVLQDPAVV